MAFKIHGRIVEESTGRGIPNLKVKALHSLLGAVTTDRNGNFTIEYDKKDFQELFFNKKPNIYLEIQGPVGKFTTTNKVQYVGDRTKEFTLKIGAKIGAKIGVAAGMVL